jgi:hypothetical protein
MVQRARRVPRFSFILFALFLLAASLPAAAGTIVVRPGTLDHFAITAPETAVAGESFLVRIDPYDSHGNLITGAQAKGGSFTVRVSGGAEVIPDRIRPTDFAGGVTVRVTDKVAEIIELSVVESGAATPLASVQVPVYPNKLDHFDVNAPKATTSGESFQVRFIARDAFGNTKIDLPDIRSGVVVEASGTGTVQQEAKQLPPFRSGEMILSFVPVKVGKVKVAVQEQTTHSRGQSTDVQIGPAPLHHIVVQGPKAAVAGEKFTLLLSAMDMNENVVTGYQTQGDGVLLTPSGDGLLDPTAVQAKEFRSGQAKVSVSYTAAGSLRVTGREMNRDLGGTSEPIIIVAGEPDHFVVTTPQEAVAGETFPIQVAALDQFNNPILDYDLRGLEVYLSTDGTGAISPSSVSPAAFSNGTATVDISYSRAESFSVIAALSKDDLEKIIRERSRRAPVSPGPVPLTPEEVAQERERELALQAREEAMQAKMEMDEQAAARDEALRAREEARKAMDEAVEAVEPAPPPEAPPAPGPIEEVPPGPGPVKVPLPTPAPAPKEPLKVAKKMVQELSQVSLIESKGQAMVMMETTGPVSYNASTGSELSKEWIYVELFPVRRTGGKVEDLIRVKSGLVGDIRVEDVDSERVKVSLQVLPPGISYVVSQQDRAVVVKIIKNE